MDMSFSLSTIQDIQLAQLREQHIETTLCPYLLKITKTDYGKGLGLPDKFWDGSYRDGEPKMIRIQDVIHAGAWKKSLQRPSVHSLPAGFTLIHFSLGMVAIDFCRFFLKYYSKRYRALPDESKPILYNGARACAIWESVAEKICLQSQGIQAFALPEVYERIVEARKIKDSYPEWIVRINAAAKTYRLTGGVRGYNPAVAYDRRKEVYETLSKQVTSLALHPLPELASLPLSVPEFKLLEAPPIELFAGV